MLKGFVKLFSGDTHKRTMESLFPLVDEINALEPEFEKLTDEELRAKTDEFRARLSNGETLDDLLDEAFAVVREAAKRTIRLRHYDVQLIGGIILPPGEIAGMRAGGGAAAGPAPARPPPRPGTRYFALVPPRRA